LRRKLAVAFVGQIAVGGEFLMGAEDKGFGLRPRAFPELGLRRSIIESSISRKEGRCR